MVVTAFMDVTALTKRNMSTRLRRRTDEPADSTAPRRSDDPASLIPLLARRVREVEARVNSKGRATPTNRT
jgi:hypothetical protein